MSNRIFLSLCFAMFGLMSLGCQPPDSRVPTAEHAGDEHEHADDEHEHAGDEHEHEHATTLAEAIAEVEQMGNAVLTAFSEERPDDAHDQLHKIGHSIESLPDLAAHSTLSGDAQQSIADAKEELMVAFGKLDDSLHGGEAADLEMIKTDVKHAMDALRSQLESAE